MAESVFVSPLANGSFETVKDGKAVCWTCPNEYEVRRGEGRNGTCALFFSNEKGEGLGVQSARQDLRIEHGRAYRIVSWVRTEDLLVGKGGCGVGVGFEWWGSDGVVKGVYSKKTVCGSVKWEKTLPLDTPVLGEDVTGCRVLLMCGRPEAPGRVTGRVWFDDVTIEPLDLPLVQNLLCDAYRSVAAHGDVRFVATLNVEDAVANGLRFELSYIGFDGKRHVQRPVGEISTSTAVFQLPVEAMDIGRQVVTCYVKDRSGKVVCCREAAFTRVREQPKRRVQFDRLGRTMVDGKPMFPLGMFCGEATEAEMGVYREAAFNCVMPYQEPTRKQLDWLYAHDLMVLYCLKGAYVGHEWAIERGFDTEAKNEAYVTDAVNRVKDHPALLAWYANDECGLEFLPQLMARQRLFERLDPQHPTWSCLYQTDTLQHYPGSYDNLGTDPYPVAKAPLAQVTEATLATLRATRGLRPAWQIPQAMDWRWFGGGTPHDRYPTRQELRSMSWQMIAAGANGLIYYAFHQMRQHAGENFTTYWADLRTIVGEIERSKPILLAGDVPPIFSCTVPVGRLPVRLFAEGHRLWLLAANAADEPVRATVTTANCQSCEQLLGEAVGLVGGRDGVSFELPVEGITLLRLR